jgi:serine/threonine-protein kinase
LLKLLREDCRHEPQAQSMLAREMEVANSVANPHLITVLEGRREAGQSYLVLPYLRGCSLADALAEGEPLPLHVLLWLARQATQGLQALHEAGWIHGDIKPANLFVSPQAHLTILDLGLADRVGPSHRVTERPVRGTPAYLAPEALHQRGNIDARSDLYSLGAVMYEMITLRRLFASESAREVIDQQRSSPTPDPRAISGNTPRALAELVRSLLAKEPLRRPESAAEVLDQLVRIEIQAFAEAWS